MDAFLGQSGTLTEIDNDNTIQVDVDQGKYWWAAQWVTLIGSRAGADVARGSVLAGATSASSVGHVFRVGERVRLPSTRQASAAGILWVEGMDAFLGQVGKVKRIDRDNTIQIDIDQGKYWWAAEWVTPIGVKPK